MVRKYIVMIAIAIFLVVSHGYGYEPTPKKIGLYLNGALAIPFTPEEFSDYWKMSILYLGAGVGYDISPSISGLLYFDWHKFGFDGDALAHDIGVGDVSITGGGASAMLISGNFKACMPSGSVRPYATLGAGLFLLSIDDAEVSYGGVIYGIEGDSENALCINGGAGLMFSASENIDLFVDGRYVLGFTEGESTSFLPIRAGIKFKL